MRQTHITVSPGGPLKGELRVPGDKSVTHRALILGAAALGSTEVEDPSTAADCRSTAAALRLLGARITRTSSGLRIQPPAGGLAEPGRPLYFGNSGTGFRLLAGLLASRPFFTVLDGDRSLRRRPMGRIIEPLRAMGAGISGRDGDRFPPLAIRGGALNGIAWESPVSSAQVKSSVLLAGLGVRGETRFTEPALSRDHTERIFPAFGIACRREALSLILQGPQQPRGARVRVPGDISSAAFWIVGALLIPGSSVTVRGVGLNPTRTGLLHILKRMGARLSWEVEEEWQREPVGTIRASFSELAATAIGADEVPAAIDEFPVLAVAAACAHGTTVISGAGELRVKESDRIAALAAQMARLGARVEERPDGMVIHGPAELRGAEVESRGDHRIAMAMAVAGLAARGRTVVRDTANVATSYPGFELDLARLGGKA